MTDKTGLSSESRSDGLMSNVFSSERNIEQPELVLPKGLRFNQKLAMNGFDLLLALPEKSVPCVFFDPQYRGVLDYLGYGNEGEQRGQKRSSLEQMDNNTIAKFIQESARILIPSGHLFLWIDKFHLATGIDHWITETSLEVVDFITWDKKRMGMGYRTRRHAEYLMVLQQEPRRAKGVWKKHNIPDVWREEVSRRKGVHPKPVGLQAELIEAITNRGDVVVDPAAGTFSVFDACKMKGRHFLGCDLNGEV